MIGVSLRLQSISRAFPAINHAFSTAKKMSIKVGDKIPSFTFKTCDFELNNVQACGVPYAVKSEDIFAPNKTIVMFAVPGAFTPTCHVSHLPGYVKLHDEFKKKGVDQIVCTSTNDAFVLYAWAKSENVPSDKVKMLSDGSSIFAKSLGLTLDLTEAGLGIRSKRYAMIVKNGIVSYLGIDEKGLEQSSAEFVLKNL